MFAKSRYIFLLSAVSIFLSITLLGCPPDPTNPPNPDPDTKDKAITINGQSWVDAKFAGADPYVYGEYYSIELVAISEGTDLRGATWSSSDPVKADVSGVGDTAVVTGKQAGSVTITVQAGNGTKQDFELQVVESTFITFDLTDAPKTGDSYQLELPLVHGYNPVPGVNIGIDIRDADDPRYLDWEYFVDWGDNKGVEKLLAANYDNMENIYPTHWYSEAKPYTIRIFTLDTEQGLQAWNYSETTRAKEQDHNWKTRWTGSTDYLVDVPRFGNGKIGEGMFFGCSNLINFSAQDTPVFAKDIDWLLDTYGAFDMDISIWDISNVTIASAFFPDDFTNGGKSFNKEVNPNAHASWNQKAAEGVLESSDFDYTPIEAINRPKGL